MSYEGFVTIMLTALGLMLAILAVGIGIAAIWGWTGIREATAKAAIDAMNLKMKEYPDAQRMLELASQMENIIGSWETIQNQLVTGITKVVAPASNVGVQVETGTPVAPPPPYPGEGVQNAGTTTANPEPHDPDPNTQEPGANSG